jgi:hypothetical protein
MAAYKNMDDLKQAILKEMESAMNDMKSKAEEVMKDETGKYHNGTSPRIYHPTGNLASSPKTSNIDKGGDTISFKAYLDESLSYEGENQRLRALGFVSRFTTPEAYRAAEEGTSHTIGNHGFWQRSETRIEQELNSVFSSHFK